MYFTGLLPETTVDSAKYAAVSREIYDSGDFLHLKIHGDPYLQKPPLHFWLSALFFKIFGVSIVAFKLPTLLFTILGIYSTYRLGRLLSDRKTGIIAAFLLATSEAVLLYNMDVHTDMLLTANIIFGTWQLMEFLHSGKALNYFGEFLGIGLAMLSKGLIGLAVPASAIGGYLFIQKDFKTIFSFKWILGALILFVVISPALKGLYDQFGWEGIRFYFWSNNVDRLRGEYSDFRHDYSFSFHTFLYLFLPWSFYSLMAFWYDWKRWRQNGFRLKGLKYSLNYVAIIPLAILVTVSSQQSPHYLLPVIPFISIITSSYLVRITSLEEKKYLKIASYFNLIISSLLCLLSFTIIIYFFPVNNIYVPAFMILAGLSAIIAFVSEPDRLKKLLIPLSMSILLLSFAVNTTYMPSALKYHGAIQACYKYNQVSEGEMLYTYNYPHFETYFYADRVSEFVDKGELDLIFSSGTAWIITGKKGFNEISENYPDDILKTYEFPYKKLTNVSFKFLNPKTREGSLSKIYLLKIY